ncbi:NDP-hexose 2,3-dehydratase family protein [Arthrospira platensis SPKY2]
MSYLEVNTKMNHFLTSDLSIENPFNSITDILSWLQESKQSNHVIINEIKFSEMKQCFFDKSTGNYRHISGGFFSIDGIEVTTNYGSVSAWRQPIINQPELGILGIITKEFDGQLYFLMQAKIEPGNINTVQLSPTLQATKSNYTQKHKGKKPLYLEYFLDTQKNVLFDQLQSEQGARFLQKRNRNIIIQVNSNIPIYENYRWLTLGQIKALLKYDNLVNMDTRTILSGIRYCNRSLVEKFISSVSDQFKIDMLYSEISTNTYISMDSFISWFTELKSLFDLSVSKIRLDDIQEWQLTDNKIRHIENKFFEVIPVKVQIEKREVLSWDQPMVRPFQQGICAFIIKKINGVYHFLVQAKVECGNFDVVEIAPTVQCLTGSYKSGNVYFLKDVLDALKNPQQVKFNTIQSEEGGRFFRESNRNIIVEVGDDFSLDVPINFNWLSMGQLKNLIRFNNYVNIQARSLLSLI